MSNEGGTKGARVVLLASDGIGSGSDDLGRILMRSFLKTLKDAPSRPDVIILLNAGVKLVAEGSDLLDDLRALEALGVDLAACGTCLDFFHLKEKVRAGRVTNMSEIVATLMAAERIVRP